MPMILWGFLLLLLTATSAAAEADAPVVLELFTSQGCSSCPLADALISRLGQSSPLRQTLIPLAYHVDYWDRLGWKDPFSAPRWTERQEAYARRFRQRGLYTPQIVIQGRAEAVGSDEIRIRAHLEAAAEEPPAGTLTLHVAPSAKGPDHLRVIVNATLLQNVPGPSVEGIVVLFENGLVTQIQRGENAGLRLRNDYVVRDLVRAFTLPVEPGTQREAEVELTLDPAWQRINLGIATFLQNPTTLAIHAAAYELVE